MLLLLAAAHAALPWECPTIVTPADADALRDTDAGLDEPYGRLYDAATAYVDASCAWVETTTTTFDTTTTERVCTDGLVEVVTTETSTYTSDGHGSSSQDDWELDVSVASGETWTRIVVHTTDTSWSSGLSGGGDATFEASWEGTFEDLPADGALLSASSAWSGPGTYDAGRRVETPSCTWDWDHSTDSAYNTEESVATDTAHVIVYTYAGWFCPDWFSAAELNGAPYGAVLSGTWADDPADADRDGVPSPCDCDDADPTRNPMEPDVLDDGIDQDCDGADDSDWDLDDDGHDAIGFGGDDCDDTDDDTHPGAEETAGDGVDQDCDGADDVDADGDGFTADGDRDAADCDDADPSVNPVGREVCVDGIDQDCDGADDRDCDNDGYDRVESGGDDCDDTERAIHPAASEGDCDGIDQDCDGADPCDTAGPDDDTGDTGDTADTADTDADDTDGCGTEGGCGGGSGALLLLLMAWRRGAGGRAARGAS